MKDITNIKELKEYNKQYFINSYDVKELPFIKSYKTNIKYYLQKIYNELWIDDIRRTNKDIRHCEIDYIIEDNNNNKNYLVGNSNYIYQNFNNLFPNNEYEFELTKIHSYNKTIEVYPEIIKKKFSNKLLVRYIEIYFIVHGIIKPLNVDLNIINIFRNHSNQTYLNNIIDNHFISNNNPLRLTNKIIINEDDEYIFDYKYIDMVKDNYNYKIAYDNLDNIIKDCIRINK